MRYVFVWMYWRAILRVLAGPAGGFFLAWLLTAQPHGFEFFWPTLIASYLVVGGIYRVIEGRGTGVLMLAWYVLLTAATLILPWSVWSADPTTYAINIIVAFAPFVWVAWGFVKHSDLLWPLPVVSGTVGLLLGVLKVLPGIVWDGVTGIAAWAHDLATRRRYQRAVGSEAND